MANLLPDENSVYNWTGPIYVQENINDLSLFSSQTDLFLQEFPWSGGDERGEESSPIHFGTVFKEEQISKKGVKRQLITEDKENDQKMKREQLDRHTESIRPMCWGEKSSQIKQLQEVIRKMEENHTNTVHILQGMILQLEKEKPRRQNIITL
ncbi:uncharacterized protein LOC134718028 [Mytilus trossulus]|uniref:uncharacterized protein LOC134718028 n=1 Tax=Mytilus trossulus TaxID=6551 RepID=UPI0030059CF4